MRVIVVGGGIVGRTVAWRLAQHDSSVTVVDPDPSRAAAQVAAGMLAAITETNYGEGERLALDLHGANRWSAFAADLEAATGQETGYHRCGTFVVARDRDDQRELDRYAAHLGAHDHDVEELDARTLRRREPALGVSVRGGLWVADDHQVDPRATLVALARAANGLGVDEVRGTAVAVAADRVELDDGEQLRGDAVVVCAGWGSRALLDVPVRAVKGQILRLAATTTAVLPRHVVRGLDVYLVTRPTGEIVVGATSEEVGEDRRVTAGGVRVLLDEARRLVPGIDEAELVESNAGLRPATPDGAPVFDTVDGVHVATGHHRNGVLLAPLTAEAVVAAVAGRGWPEEVRSFDLGRFGVAA